MRLKNSGQIVIEVALQNSVTRPMMKFLRFRLLTAAVCLCAAFVLTGCFETKDEFTLNPDGSGKVVHESTFQNLSLSGDEDNSEQGLKDAIAKVIEGARGIEAWRDVSFKRLDDGRLYFKGTAYFTNLSMLDLGNSAMLKFNWTNSANGIGTLTLHTIKDEGEKRGIRIEKKQVDLSKLTPGERAAKMKEERAKYQQMKPMMAGIMGTMKHEVVFHLPGKLSESSNFTRNPSGGLTLTFEGAKLLEAMDKLVNDDAWLEKNINNLGGTEKPAMDDEMNALIFGSKAPLRAAVSGANQAVFNYAAEVAAAKPEFTQIQKQLGTAPVTIASPAQVGELKSLKVVGVRLVRESDKKREIRPFNYDEGYTLVLLAELPGSVLAVTDKSGLDSAMADDGSDLLPDSEWKRRFSFPKLSADKAAVLLEVNLKAPGPGVKGLKELSGHLQYSVSGSTKEIDLGFAELKADARGAEMGAHIRSIKEGWQKDGSQQMQLKLNTSKEALKAVHLVAGGTKTELNQRGYGGGGGTYSFDYEYKTAFPPDGKLIAEVHDQMQTFDVTFKLENISLLGDPAGAH